jgi:CRP/FNR family transcriptional regulator, cyclic AMP receptor protein
MSQNLLLQTLQGNQFLRGVAREHMEQIAEIADFRDYEVGEIVFRKGDRADSIFLVASGQLSIELCVTDTNCKRIMTVGPGEMLGWSSLLDRPHLAALARAIEPTRVVRIDSGKLQAICDEDPEFGYQFTRRVMAALAVRLHATWAQLSHIHVAHYVPVSALADDSDD